MCSMDNKVIIGLDEYLKLKNKNDEILKLNAMCVINEEDGYSIDPLGPLRHKVKREIVIHKKDLNEYINGILGIKDYEVRIVED